VKTLNLEVVDKNEHVPLWNQPCPRKITISEDKSIGSLAFSARANDQDFDAKLEYSLQSESNLPFSISEGEVILKEELDREEVDAYEFNVKVSDGEFEIVCGISLSVEDVNDNAPVFSEQMGSDIFIPFDKKGELPRVGSVLATVKAFDRDSGENSRVSYRMTETSFNNERSDCLKVDAFSGDIVTSAELKIGLHKFIVQAYDHGVPSKSSEMVFYVYAGVEKPSKVSTTLVISYMILTSILLTLLLVLFILWKFPSKLKCCRESQIEDNLENGAEKFGFSRKSTEESGSLDSYWNQKYENKSKLVVTDSQNSSTYSEVTQKMLKNKNSLLTVTSEKVSLLPRNRSSTPRENEGVLMVFPNSENSSTKLDSGRETMSDQERKISNHLKNINELGPKCTMTCLTLGHSDVCWDGNGDNQIAREQQEVSFASSHQIMSEYGIMVRSKTFAVDRSNKQNCGISTSSSSNEIEVTGELLKRRRYEVRKSGGSLPRRKKPTAV